jgi:hypothetical protein
MSTAIRAHLHDRPRTEPLMEWAADAVPRVGEFVIDEQDDSRFEVATVTYVLPDGRPPYALLAVRPVEMA